MSQLIAAFIAVWGFGRSVNIPRKSLFCAAGNGACGWLLYLMALNGGCSVYFSNFIGSLAIAVGAQILARRKKTPVTVFVIPGIMTLVPGAGMYRIAYYIIEGFPDVSAFYLQQTIQIAGVIALAVFLAEIVGKTIRRRNQSARWNRPL